MKYECELRSNDGISKKINLKEIIEKIILPIKSSKGYWASKGMLTIEEVSKTIGIDFKTLILIPKGIDKCLKVNNVFINHHGYEIIITFEMIDAAITRKHYHGEFFYSFVIINQNKGERGIPEMSFPLASNIRPGFLQFNPDPDRGN